MQSYKSTNLTSNFRCGLWIDNTGKQLIISHLNNNFYEVTILNKNAQTYRIDLLDEFYKETKNLSAKYTKDINKNSILRIEAGNEGVGPTYDLSFLTKVKGKYRPTKKSDRLDNIIIRPNVSMGLYDDWEDDLGVPWAFPLYDFKKKAKFELDSFGSLFIKALFGRFSDIIFPVWSETSKEEKIDFLTRILLVAVIIGLFIYFATNYL